MADKQSVIAFVWGKYAPYHMDRIEAAHKLLGADHDILAIQKTYYSKIYEWDIAKKGRRIPIVTLLDGKFKRVPFIKIMLHLCRVLLQPDVQYIFICEYQYIYTFITALICRLHRKRVFVMNNAKFDDKQRSLFREIIKFFLYLPYNGALVSGRRTVEYLRFLGFVKRPVMTGYNTLSINRVRRNANSKPAPEGVPFLNRHFTVVARLVSKKNLSMLIEAYYIYQQIVKQSARPLHICGSGPEERAIKDRISKLKIRGVVFHGFLQEKGVAKVLASSLALLLPSIEEQWGLVVNEALAMGLPIVCSDNVGARDVLVKNAVNGYTIESDNPIGLAHAMVRLHENENEWRRMALESLKIAPLGDAANFALGVKKLLNATP